jgi:hypothetical protein
MAPGAEPLSIESLLQKQKEEREAAARVSTLFCRCSLAYLIPFILAQVLVQGGARKNRYC